MSAARAGKVSNAKARTNGAATRASSPLRVANPNVPTPFNRILEELSIPSARQVADAVRQVMA